MRKDPIYLDHAASTPLDPRALEAMLPLLEGPPTNPSSIHSPGQRAHGVVEEAREKVAALIGAIPAEIFFASGGTESDALAVLGLARSAPSDKKHAIVSSVEHAAVREAASRLESEGWEITRLSVDSAGMVDPAELEESIRGDTAFAAVMWANNEVGTVQPVEKLAGICRERGIPFHTDAVQAAGQLPLDVGEIPVSTLALASHKLYGPQGAGVLYVRDGVGLEALLPGGGQEKGLRSGTQNVASIAGFGEAARLALEEMGERAAHERELRDAIAESATAMDGVSLNGHPEERLPNNVHLTVEGVEAEGLMLFCDAFGYAISSGSACASSGAAGHRASPVLGAMGLSEREALSSVRITAGKDTTAEEVEGFVDAFATAVGRLRELSPVYAGGESR